ncbi:MAG: alginate export family protein [Desulfococcaceae bacterium]|jgi:hypothetical protein|nr:alginate export family protein [Desulfococcaceae bacterium]
MKKLFVVFLTGIFFLIPISPSSAVENQFGGHWYTLFFSNQNFSGEDRIGDKDMRIVDTQTRLYYTAVFHENLKFVNKFEFSAQWGDTEPGDIGADGTVFEIKNSYVDFNISQVSITAGIQGLVFSRGFIFDDDAAGAVITYQSDLADIQLFWLKAYEGGTGKDANDYDVDYYGITPLFRLGENWQINPFFMYIYSDDTKNWTDEEGTPFIGDNAEEVNLWYAGLNLDADFDRFSLWCTGIYQGGDMSFHTENREQDFSAWLAAAGGSIPVSGSSIRAQFFYASGDDNPDDDEWKRYWVPRGQSYYWAEIMGYGIIDYDYSANSPGDQISDIMAANIGVTFNPPRAPNVSISLDVWYAALAEDIYVRSGNKYSKGDAPSDAGAENYLGTEVDLVFTVELVKGLEMDIVGAYLFAGEATTQDSPNDANPYEIGTRLSLSF